MTIPTRNVTKKLDLTRADVLSNNCQKISDFCYEECVKKGLVYYPTQKETANNICGVIRTLFNESIFINGKPLGESPLCDKIIKDIEYQILNKLIKIFPDNTKQRLMSSKKPDPARFLFLSHLLMPGLDAAHFDHNLETLKNIANAIWAKIDSSYQRIPRVFAYLYSDKLGSSGKTLFTLYIEKWCKKNNVCMDTASFGEGQFRSPAFANNFFVLISEYNPKKNHNQLNDVTDGINYVVEEKYQKPFSAKAVCFPIITSNFLPDEDNWDRMYASLLRFSPQKLVPANHKNLFLLQTNNEPMWDLYTDLFEEWLISAPEQSYQYLNIYDNSFINKLVDILGDENYHILREVIVYLKDNSLQYTPNAMGIKNALERQVFEKNISHSKLSAIFRTLNNYGIIKATTLNKEEKYVKYDFTPLFEKYEDIKSSEVSSPLISSTERNIYNESTLVKACLNSIGAIKTYGDNDPLVIANNRLKEQSREINEQQNNIQ